MIKLFTSILILIALTVAAERYFSEGSIEEWIERTIQSSFYNLLYLCKEENKCGETFYRCTPQLQRCREDFQYLLDVSLYSQLCPLLKDPLKVMTLENGLRRHLSEKWGNRLPSLKGI